MNYNTSLNGIALGESSIVAWADLADALASAFHPGSSAMAIRNDLTAALNADEVDGEYVHVLRQVLAATDPVAAVRNAATIHPSEIDPRGWAEAANQIL
jgi:hypothetical protein